jgi:hypothetical protein
MGNFIGPTPGNAQYFGQPLFNGKKPPEGPRGVTAYYNFTGGLTPSFTTDLTSLKQAGGITMVQAIWIDNSANNQPLEVGLTITGQQVSCPAGDQGFYPVLVASQAKFNISCTGTGLATIIFLNTEINPIQYQALASGSVLNPQPVTDAILEATVVGNRVGVLTTPAPNVDTDNSGTIGIGGTAQQIFAANAARKGYFIQNIDEAILEELRICSTGTATLANPGSIVLGASGGVGYPGGSFQGYGDGAISIIGATAGHKFTAFQW